LNELSLFTGAGGGLLGTKLLGWKAIGYVEKEPYCQKVIRQRIADGILDAAPIFGDIRKFISEGYAAAYTGLVDVITGGFPCQPFSVAGKRKQADDERNMWPATADVIGIVKPRFVLLENVPGVREYLPVVVRDLRRCGYEVSHPLQLGADDVGAPHRRKRVWIMAYSLMCADSGRERQDRKENRLSGINRPEICGGMLSGTSNVAYASEREDDGRKRGYLEETAEGWESINAPTDTCGEDVPDAETKGLERQDAARNTCTDGRFMQFAGRDWWATEPDVGRVAHGVAHRVDRLKAIGNGQVPAVVACAWRTLMGT
jgi:DNA (cytosine-5)-methyltransferase 1